MTTIARVLSLAVILASVSCSNNTPKPAAQAVTDAPKHPTITMFYAPEPHPVTGQPASLCYGVENADTVSLDPAVDRVWPTTTRCFDIPTKSAVYTLTAMHGTEKVSRSVTVSPVFPKPKLFQIMTNPQQVAAGEKVAVCYNAMDAVEVKIEPGAWFGPHGPSMGCIRDQPTQTTTYTLTATGQGGDRDVQKITVRVMSKP